MAVFAAALWVVFWGVAVTQTAFAQDDVLTPAARYDVLKHKLNVAILAKNPKETIEIIEKLRKTPLGVSGETLFYEAHAHYQLKNWTAAYKALVAYLNSMGRKGRNYKAGIGLFVEIEGEIKKSHRTNTNLARADKTWTAASAAYDQVLKRRNAWKERVVTFGGPKDDMAWAMARRSNGGFLVGGTFTHKADEKQKMKAGRSMGIMALTRGGRLAWNRVIIGPAKDGAVKSLKSLSEGGFLLGGVHRGFQIAARIDENAVPIRNYDGKPWINTYAPTKDGAGGVVSTVGQDGFVALGTEVVAKDGKGPRLPFVLRMSSDGKSLGKTVYTGNAARYWHDIADAVELPGGDVVAVGETRPQAAWDTRPGMGYLLRIKPQGKVVWARRVPAQVKGGLRFSAVAPAVDGGLIAAGRHGGDLILFKAGDNGQEQWRKTVAHRDIFPESTRELCNVPRLVSLVKRSKLEKNLPDPEPGRIASVRKMVCETGTPFVSASAISVRKDGYLVLGFQGRGNRKTTDIRLIAIDKSGEILWDKIYGHDGFDIATSALATEDGGAIIAGATNSIGAGGRDFLIFKVDGDGNFAPWTRLGPPVGAKTKPENLKPAKIAPVSKSPEKLKERSDSKPGPAAKNVGDGDDRVPANKKTDANSAPVPDPVAKKGESGENKVPSDKDAAGADAVVKPEPKSEPVAKKDTASPQDKESLGKEVEETSAPEAAPAAKKGPAGDSAPSAAQSGEEPPETSFGDIFGSIFGSGESKEPETKKDESAPAAPDSAP